MNEEEENQQKVEDLVKRLEDFDKYYKSRPEIYDRYLKLLFKGGRYVLEALMEQENQEEKNETLKNEILSLFDQGSSKNEKDLFLERSCLVPVLKNNKIQEKLKVIWTQRNSYDEAALTSHNSDAFYLKYLNPLNYSIRNLSGRLKENKSRYNEIAKECESSTKVSDSNQTYLDELRNKGTNIKSIQELYEEAKQNMKGILEKVIHQKVSDKNEITLTLCVTNKELQTKLKNAVSKASTDIIIGQDDKNDTLTEVVDKFLAEIKKEYGFTSVTFRLGSNTGDSLDAVERNWETCVRSSDEKMALDLLSKPDDLPDKETLNELCAVFGRKSDITFKVCKKVCNSIKESNPHIIDVYASRKAVVLKHYGEKEEEFEIKFVVITENMDEDGRKKLKVRIQKDYDTLPIRDHYQLSGEEKECSKRRRHELKGEDLNRIKTSMRLNAHSLLEKHTYLTIISGCPFKSKGYDTGYHETDFKQPCIVLNVPYKGHIPIDEDPFQNEYDGVLTDVREDIFVLYNGTAKDRHDHLKAGCLISGKKDNSGRCCKGTLGGFVVHPDYGPCGISCCHALLTPSELNELSENNEINWKRPSLLEGKHDKALDGNVYQPYDNGEGDINKIGSLVRVCYKSGKTNSLEADACGMEVTLFQLSNRLPKSSEFPVVKVSGANVLTEESNEDSLDCRKVPHQFGKGAVAGFDWLEGERYCKFGAITGYTTGELSINCTTSVKKPNTWTQKDKLNTNNNFRFILHNQVSIKKKNTDINNILPTDIPTESEERFAYLGDSGALVYRETTDGNLVCVGMVAGGPKEQTTCIVTPILPILKELGITGFKDFDSEQLEVNVKTLVGDTGDLRKKIDRMDGDLRQKMDSGFKDISNQLSNMQNSRFPCEII